MKSNNNLFSKLARISLTILAFIGQLFSGCDNEKTPTTQKQYVVNNLKTPLIINADGNKLAWKKVKALGVVNYMGDKPEFDHDVHAKVLYDDEHLYVIFKVKDKYVRCHTDSINGPVWEDSCVEFFFAPDTTKPLRYFNLEINCAGTPLMHYNRIARKDYESLDPEDIRKIKIASSIDSLILNEIQDEVIWTLEYSIPLQMLEKYSNITKPAAGVEWKANFYKIAHKSSHPHYITWSPVDIEGPEFHSPEYFGVIKFE